MQEYKNSTSRYAEDFEVAEMLPTFNHAKFGICIDKILPGTWSICFGLSHFDDETYVYINLVKYNICIGKLRK